MDRELPGAAAYRLVVDGVVQAIRSARTSDPLAPVTVLVPSNYAGLAMRRALGRLGGVANVGFMVPSRVAELLAGPLLGTGGRPLTPEIRREAIRAVLSADAEGPFAAVAAHASTVAALEATFRELRTLDNDELEQFRARSPRARALVERFERFRRLITGYHDELDRFRAAAHAVAQAGPDSPVLGQVIALAPRGLNPEARVFYEAFEARGRLHLVAAPEPGQEDVAGRVSIHVAVDEDEEVRSALRVIARAMDEGIALHRIAVLFPSPSYGPRCVELFASAGIPCNGAAGESLAGSVAGRCLLALLHLNSSTADRDDVLGALALPLPGIDGYTERWNALARDARATRGLDRWIERLRIHAAMLRHDAVDQPEEFDNVRSRLLRDAAVTDTLAEAVARLQQLSSLSHLSSWSEFGAWAAQIVEGVAHRLTDDAQRNHADAVREVVAQLGQFDAIGGRPTARVFEESLVAALSAQRTTKGRFEEGVFIGSLDDAYGMGFDLAIVVGCTEGALPVAAPDDPLIPAEDRAEVPGLATAHQRHRIRQQQAFDWVCETAGELVLSVPLTSLAGQRRGAASPWVLRVASRLHGGSVYASDLDRWKESPERPDWLEVTPSFAAAVTAARVIGSETEWMLSALGPGRRRLDHHPLLTAAPELAAAFEAIASHASSEFSRFDGFVGAEPGLSIIGDAPVSPTRLEWWSQCGYRYYLASVLRVTENEEPEEPDAITARDRGTLVHAVFDEFFAERGPGRLPSEAWTVDDARDLDGILTHHIELAESSGKIGRHLPWLVAEAQLREALHAVLEDDSTWRREQDVTFLASEYGFGRPARESRPAGSSPDLLGVETPIGTVTFRGEIDRIDRAGDGSLVVYDYKTGKSPVKARFDAVPFDDGARLQLPVYALAAEAIHGAPGVRAAYWYVMRERGPGRFVIDVDQSRADEFRALLGHISGGIAAGVFPARSARPGDPALCRYCPYDLVCPVDRAYAHERKRTAPSMAPYFSPGAMGTADEPDDSDE